MFVKGQQKVWVVLFTCAVYRAVHLEIIDSLSTEAFALALRRFVARRGKVSQMWSDNATNFTGFNNALKCVKNSGANIPVLKWVFNPPAAPWWGGWFERLIGVMKQLLRKTLGRAVLSLTELTTVLTEVEAILNARPITYTSDDSQELRPISPSMFLQDQTNYEVSDIDLAECLITARLKYVKEVKDNLKKRFKNEYLGALALHQKKVTDQFKVGDVVWIESDNKKRIEWEKGLIVELFKGKDGFNRVCKLKTEKGELVRPLQRCFLLEASGETLLVSNGSCNNNDNKIVSEDVIDNVELPFNCGEVMINTVNAELSKTKRGRIIHKPSRLDL